MISLTVLLLLLQVSLAINQFIVTGAKCDPDTGACFPFGKLFSCQDISNCVGPIQEVLDLYGTNISWVILIPEF